ncbi:hypothetical protein E2C06_24030 [Dankookia rubra]|uniref:Ribbon-helix-helix protein, CopG family n=1 Tax=Dankookia rubra TaxID=1442381 RepID=A0A4R5QCG1_9PROT|nr:hypothetical protein [Dankookia rubra]TDH60111.1 hypothetical protein E2C06_24030 [Dankookia rubra]
MSKPDAALSSVSVPRAAKGMARPAAPARIAAPQSISEVPRKTISTRLTVDVQERLRKYAFDMRQDKQVAIEEALDAYLRQHGY